MILAALTVVFSRNPLYNVLSLVVAIFCLSSLFIQMEAFFVGVILLLVYAGAVLVFFLFVVMCLNLYSDTHSTLQQSRFRLLGCFIGLLYLSGFYIATKSFLAAQSLGPSSIRGTIETVGKFIFTDYLLPFELTSFLLLIATFGIVSLAKGAMDTDWDRLQDIKKGQNK
jgi:NADH-quinone oxidoreductase subunit J